MTVATCVVVLALVFLRAGNGLFHPLPQEPLDLAGALMEKLRYQLPAPGDSLGGVEGVEKGLERFSLHLGFLGPKIDTELEKEASVFLLIDRKR